MKHNWLSTGSCTSVSWSKYHLGFTMISKNKVSAHSLHHNLFSTSDSVTGNTLRDKLNKDRWLLMLIQNLHCNVAMRVRVHKVISRDVFWNQPPFFFTCSWIIWYHVWIKWNGTIPSCNKEQKDKQLLIHLVYRGDLTNKPWCINVIYNVRK